MDINIHSMGMPFGPDTIAMKSLGGSETAAFYLARGLAKRGHRVLLWTNEQVEGIREDEFGVRYCFSGFPSQAAPLGDKFEFYARSTPMDVLIVQRIHHAFQKRYSAKICILQLHDLALKRSQHQVLSGTWQMDVATCVSEWHAQQVSKTYDIPRGYIAVVPNGVDPELYVHSNHGKIKYGEAKNERDENIYLPARAASKLLLLYQSRPERGLMHLVRPGGIMDRLRDSNVHLVYCGYDHTLPQVAGMYAQLDAMGAALPNVTNIGALTKAELAELQLKSDLLVYPSEFEEVSCITAMEAMHAGLPMLASDVGALRETCAGAGVQFFPLTKEGTADEDMFVEYLSSVSESARRGPYPTDLLAMRSLQVAAASEKSWDKATDALLQVIDDAFARRNSSAGAILRTAIERSDIHFAKWYLECVPASKRTEDPIVRGAEAELRRMYAFSDSDSAYKAHYDHHQGKYYDEHESSVIGEDVTRSTRFSGVAELMAQAHMAARGAPLCVLDYGCAHGHYTIPLAKGFPTSKFVGVDISERAVRAAAKWATRDDVANTMFVQGGEEYIRSIERKFDVILAGEVVEHARDWIGLLNDLANRLNPGGLLIITTPIGRWEHTGTEAFRSGREHLLHLERQDIVELCADHEVNIMCAPASRDRSDEMLGSWVFGIRLNPRSEKTGWGHFSHPDYERKLKTYAPRQTISACMIVKNAEKTLRKAVESFIDWVDEVRIFVDTTTTDRTVSVAQSLQEDFPNRPFTIGIIPSVLKIGFDEARNHSIEGATGDWILWCDADEELHQPWGLHKLARPSMHTGYGLAQVHYAINPPQVLTTDFPVRLFRNGMGLKFFGVVHEHPESEPGKSTPYSIMRPECQFLHGGYVDEETRRNRYLRNYPLLVRDVEKYPTRSLNKFLWLRDLAQGIMFEQEQMGGRVGQEHVDRAKLGIAQFVALLDSKPQPRMVIDCLQYYSHFVSVASDSWFEADLNFKVRSPTAPDLAVTLSANGRFHDRAFYQKLISYILEESTKTYEEKYF